MNCYYHEDATGVATCQYCGKFLCKSCASKFTPCKCKACNQIEKKDAKADALVTSGKDLVIAALKGVVSLIVCTLLFGEFHIMYFFVPFGWAAITYLEQFFPFVFLFNFIVVFIYFAIKFAFSILLGIPLFIIQMVILIMNYVRAKKMDVPTDIEQ